MVKLPDWAIPWSGNRGMSARKEMRAILDVLLNIFTVRLDTNVAKEL
jgi:hypothetical protein